MVDLKNIAWCIVPGQLANEGGYYLYRRKFTSNSGERFKLIVSADNRYNLYLDGEEIGRGPCRSDLLHYSYDEYQLEPGPGTHVLALECVVWRGGWRNSASPWGECHAGGGVLVGGDLAMPREWRCQVDAGRRALEWSEAWNIQVGLPVPPMDQVDFNLHDHRWNLPEFDDRGWQEPVPLGTACFRENGMPDLATPWLLEKRTIAPQRCEEPGKISVPEKIAAGFQRTVIDLKRNQTSLIRLRGRGGSGTLRIVYHEAWEKNPDYADAYGDRLILPEKNKWEYRSFHFRTARWLEIITDLAEECQLELLEARFITYDFGAWRSYRNPDDPMLEEIYNIGVHTARCCAHDSYEDCPYYEQLQYGGDTRIQALISYEGTGHGALGRRWLESFDNSRLPCGLTQSRYPSVFPQVIPGFSLSWVLGIGDYLRYFPDREFAEARAAGIKAVLDYFERLRRDDGLIGEPDFWNFTDWTTDWPYGCSDRQTGQPETILNLFYVLACRSAAEVTGCAVYLSRAERTVQAVRSHSWDPERGLLRDVPGNKWYSVHANALGILAGCVDDPAAVAEKILNESELTNCSLYFDFYVLEAMRACKCRHGFRQVLRHWEPFVLRGDTTFPEVPSPETRSHCHGWSASPVYHLLRGLPDAEPV